MISIVMQGFHCMKDDTLQGTKRLIKYRRLWVDGHISRDKMGEVNEENTSLS